MTIQNRAQVAHEVEHRAHSLVLNTALIFLTLGSLWLHAIWGGQFFMTPLFLTWLAIHSLPVLQQIDRKSRPNFYELVAICLVQIYFLYYFKIREFDSMPVAQTVFLSTTVALVGFFHRPRHWALAMWFLVWISGMLWLKFWEGQEFDLRGLALMLTLNGAFLGLFLFMTQREAKKISHKLHETRGKEELDPQRTHAARLAMLGELTTSLGHEISNPLTSIKGYNQQIQIEITESAQPSREMIRMATERIDFNIDRVVRLTKALRMYARGENAEPAMESISVSRLIEESTILIEPMMHTSRVQFKKEIPVDEDFVVRGDVVQLGQVLMNLLSNAKDAVGDLTRREVEIGAVHRGEFVEIYVLDTGLGIPMNIQNKIYERYFTTKAVGKGTGLGLAISFDIAKKHNGNLHFTCPTGPRGEPMGTRFSLTLPLQEVVPQRRQAS